MIETWIPIIISFFALVISILALRISWITKNPIFHFEDIPPEGNLGVQRVIITNTGFGAGIHSLWG